MRNILEREREGGRTAGSIQSFRNQQDKAKERFISEDVFIPVGGEYD